MTTIAAVAVRNGEGETKEGSMDRVVETLVGILGWFNPEDAFLGALEAGAIPDDICLELAEHLGELVKAKDLDNRIEIVFALRESGAISEKTEQYLLLAILEMDEQEEAEVEVGSEPTETEAISLPVPTLEATAAPPLEPSTEGQTGQAQAPPANLTADLIRSAAELQAQFGTNLPEDKQSEIRQAVGKLAEEEFSSLRQILGSAILAQAEVSPDQRRIDVAASLEVVDILLGQRQAELTAAVFIAYEVLVREGFRLTHRNGYDRPLMTVSSTTLLRNRFRKWLDSREAGLGEEKLVSAQKAVAALEKFLLAAADNRVKTAIQRDHAVRLRERIISSSIRVLDAVNEELVTALPQTKEEAFKQVWGFLEEKRRALASELRLSGDRILAEAEAMIRRILDLHSACSTLRHELAELEASDYNPLAQRPALTNAEKYLAFFELERKELESIRAELGMAVEEAIAVSGRERKKLETLLAITVSKMEELDRLIAGLRSPAPTLEVQYG